MNRHFYINNLLIQLKKSYDVAAQHNGVMRREKIEEKI